MLSGVPIAMIVLFLRRYIPESPRWLLTHGREPEAETVIKEIEKAVSAEHGALTPVTGAVLLHVGSKDVLRKISLLLSKRSW